MKTQIMSTDHFDAYWAAVKLDYPRIPAENFQRYVPDDDLRRFEVQEKQGGDNDAKVGESHGQSLQQHVVSTAGMHYVFVYSTTTHAVQLLSSQHHAESHP